MLEVPDVFLDRAGKKPHENFRSVQRRKGNQVQRGKDDVDIGEEYQRPIGNRAFGRHCQLEKKERQKGKNEVRNDSGGRNGYECPSVVSYITEIDGHRPRPSEAEDKEHYRAHGIKVLEGIQAQPTH